MDEVETKPCYLKYVHTFSHVVYRLRHLYVFTIN